MKNDKRHVEWQEQQEQLYPTLKEERLYRELKKRYGFEDARTVKAQGEQQKAS